MERLIHMKKKLSSFIFRVKNLKRNVIFRKNVILDKKTKFEGNSVINKNVTLHNVYVGEGTYIGKESELLSCKIGRYTCIAPQTKIILGTHPTNSYVSIHPAFYSLQKQAGFTFVEKQKFNEFKNIGKTDYSVIIGNDVWIGYGVTILQGVNIGDGAIIGAGSIVTKDIEPYSINVGVPAKKIRERFSRREIVFLESFKWWDKDRKWLKENSDFFIDIKNFTKYFEGEL